MRKSRWVPAWSALLLVMPGLVFAQVPSEPTVRAVKDGRTAFDRREAARQLGRIYPPDAESLAALRGGLSDPDFAVVAECVRSLCRLGADAPAVVRALNDSRPRVPKLIRTSVYVDAIREARFLGAAAKPAVPLLVRLLRHDEPDIRVAALEGIAAVGPAAVEAITPLDALLNGKPDATAI